MLFLVGGPIGAVLLNISGVFAADSESENSENRSPIGAPGALRRWIWARGFGGASGAPEMPFRNGGRGGI